MQLRPRQVEFVDKCLTALTERDNTLGVAPTGAGKTVMLSAITGRLPGPSLVVQHRDELVAQNRRTFHAVNPGVPSDIYTAARKRWVRDGATFGMIQTLARNLDSVPELSVLTIDEAHHSAANSYLQLIDAVRKRNPKVKLLGLTATPNRGDKKALRGVFDNCADQISLRELIASGFLVRPRTFVIDIGVQSELRNVKKLASDFDMGAVEAIMDKEPINDRIVEEWAKIAGSRQTVVFCSTVAHATHVAAAFQARGIKATVVDGTMSDADRRSALAAYDRGDIQVVVNVAVLTEGWDHQPTSCVILLRPSSYKSTMIQMIGRGLRKVDPERYPGIVKDDCIVLDFGTSILLHGAIEQDVDLDQKGTKDCGECGAVVPAQVHECPICGTEFPKPPEELTDEEDDQGEGDNTPKVKEQIDTFIMTEIDLLNMSPFRWETLFDGLVMVASAFEAWAVCVNYAGVWHALGGGKDLPVRVLSSSGDRMISLASADDWMREHGDSATARKTKGWLSAPPTDKQLNVLGLTPMSAVGLTRYRAGCFLTWRFNERVIQNKIVGLHRSAA